MKTMELGPDPPFFFGADPRWSCWSWLCLADNFWSGVGFLDLELREALPNTPSLVEVAEVKVVVIEVAKVVAEVE
jgi:hypothetical protein